MSNRRVGSKRVDPRATSRDKDRDDVDVFNGLQAEITMVEAELAALELLIGWDWLGTLVQTCAPRKTDI